MALGAAGLAVALLVAVAPPAGTQDVDLSAVVRSALHRPPVASQALPLALMGLCARLREPPAHSGRYGPACVANCAPTCFRIRVSIAGPCGPHRHGRGQRAGFRLRIRHLEALALGTRPGRACGAVRPREVPPGGAGIPDAFHRRGDRGLDTRPIAIRPGMPADSPHCLLDGLARELSHIDMQAGAVFGDL